MFKETLLITPKLSAGDLNSMERSLSSRFTKVAKGFGKGLLGVLGGAGVVGLVGGALGGAITGIYDRLVAPLKETQDAIQRTLKKADDISTNARAFGSTTGELARLEAMGRATGIDPEQLSIMIQKFQGAVAEANADPSKQTSVRQYAGIKNSVAGFYEFIQALQKMDKNQQVVVQQEVFGEKQILHLADFLQSNFKELNAKLGGPSDKTLTKAIDGLAQKNDKLDMSAAQRGLRDYLSKANAINDGVLTSINAQAEKDLARENRRIQSFNSLMKIEEYVQKIQDELEKATLKLVDIGVQATATKAAAKGIEGSPVVRLPGKRPGEF